MDDRIGNDFAWHPATDVTGPQHDAARAACLGLAEWFDQKLPAGRHKSLAITALEEAMHWANAAIACDTPA